MDLYKNFTIDCFDPETNTAVLGCATWSLDTPGVYGEWLWNVLNSPSGEWLAPDGCYYSIHVDDDDDDEDEDYEDYEEAVDRITLPEWDNIKAGEKVCSGFNYDLTAPLGEGTYTLYELVDETNTHRGWKWEKK